MNNTKIYILSLLTVFITTSVSAQNLSIRQQSVSAKSAASQESKMVDKSSPDYKIMQFEKSIARRDSVVENGNFKDRQKIDSLKLSASERDSIIFYQKKMLAERTDYEDINRRLSALAICDFFDRQDVRVFTDYKNLEFSSLSSCNQIKYSLIEKISSVNEILIQIEGKIFDTNIKKFAENNSVSFADAKDFLTKSAEKDLLNADNKMTEIDELNLSVLSLEQQNFYKQALLNKYRAIYRKIYSE
jgi:hypothetical protein